MTVQDVLEAANQLSQADRLQVTMRLLESLMGSYAISIPPDRLAVDYEQWLIETRHKVEVALQQIDRGEILNGEVVIDRLHQKLAQARSAN